MCMQLRGHEEEHTSAAAGTSVISQIVPDEIGYLTRAL